MANEVHALTTVFWRVQRNLHATLSWVGADSTSSQVHGLECPVRGLAWVAIPAVSLLLVLQVLLGELAEKAELLSSI